MKKPLVNKPSSRFDNEEWKTHYENAYEVLRAV